jgi:hypothetical protein
MRRIKIGDRVQAFLDSRIVGIVTAIEETEDVPWMVGGTASKEFACTIKLDTGASIKYKLSELHHLDV